LGPLRSEVVGGVYLAVNLRIRRTENPRSRGGNISRDKGVYS
jgi:hypothetical protein